MNRLFGWLLPNKKFVNTGQWHHVTMHPDILALRPEFSAEWDHVEAVRASCQEMTDREGSSNGEWHLYEMASDDFRHYFVQHMYDAGCLRVASSGCTLHFEGRPETVRDRMLDGMDFADTEGWSDTKFDVAPVPKWWK